MADRSESYLLEREVRVALPVDQVFPFFARAENLNLLTPRDLSFEIKTPLPIEMRVGALIDYSIRLMGVPMAWRTEITVWEPPHRFADLQLRGPYALWDHLHEFVADGDGTLIRDRVRYRPRGGPLAPLVHALFVRRKIEQIFDYRTRRIEELFRDGPPAGA